MKRALLGFAITAAVLIAAPAVLRSAQRGGFGQRDVIPDGSRVEYKVLTSKLLSRDIRFGLYLPPSYAASPSRRYPVLYFLHGLNENEMRWSTRGLTDLKMDKMIAEGKLAEFIVAIPFGAVSFYTNFRDGSEKWEDMLVTEFLPHIESTYRVQASRKTRAISGISMGGFGALKIAMRHPERFGSVSAHSAVLLKDLNAANVRGRRLDMMVGLFDRIFGINQDLKYWDENNPITLAGDTRRLNGMQIYVDCGTEDEYGFADGTRHFDELLTKAGYPHEAHLYPGNHGWDYAMQHTPESLMFHARVFSGK